MVKVSAPMMSLAASGTLADAITFSTWKGRPYVRERVIPSNPRSGAQVGRRAMMTYLTQKWHMIAPDLQATWQDLADQLVASRFNGYLSYNMKEWHNFKPPTHSYPTARNDSPGTVGDATTAEWEENRIKLVTDLSLANDNIGIIIFASLTTGFDTAVGNAIIVQRQIALDPITHYWTPPSIDTWYFNTRLFTKLGYLDVEEGEVSAVP